MLFKVAGGHNSKKKKNTHTPCLPGPTGLLRISWKPTFCIVVKLEGSTESKYPNPLILEVKKQKMGVSKSLAGLRMCLILDYKLLVFFKVPIILGAFYMCKYNCHMPVQSMIYHQTNHFRGNNSLYEMNPTRFI